MKCSLIDGHIRLFLPDQTDSSAFEPTQPAKDYAGLRADNHAALLRSALQRPEVSRAHLAALLRKALKKQESKKARKTYWSAFMANYIGRNANGNDTGS